MSFALSSAPIIPGNQPTSVIFEEKVNVDHAAPPLNHLLLGGAVLIGVLFGIGVLNHKANR
jgi:hypothetical protein